MSFEGNIELLIAGRPFNMRQKAGNPGSEHDIYKKQDLADLLDISDVVLNLVRMDTCSASLYNLLNGLTPKKDE